MKKFGTLIAAFVLLLAFAVPAGSVQAAVPGAIKLIVDGAEVEGYEQPFFSHGEVLIPVENVFGEAGYQVSKEKNVLTAANSYLTVDFNVKAGEIKVNGKKANTVFPLTLQNAGNYVSGTFLASLEGFDVKVAEDEKSVSVTTNRVQDVDKFLEKTLEADLKSFSADMQIDQTMTMAEEDPIRMLMDMKMDAIQDPLSMYMEMTMKMDLFGEAMNETSKTYVTKDGMYQYDSTVGKWIKMDDELTDLLNQLSGEQADPKAQLELMKKFSEGVQIFEYEDKYVMTQTLTNEQFKEMMDEAFDLIGGMIPDMDFPEDEAGDEEAAEEDNTVVEDDDIVIEDDEEMEDIGNIFDAMELNIEQFFVTSTIDKKTLFPLDMTSVTKMTMGIDEETMSIDQKMTGTYSNFNKIKEIKVPADVIKNAITMDEYLELLENMDI